MSLIPCPECGHQVSAGASACPECGFPFDEASAANEARPSMPVGPAIGNALPLRVVLWNFFEKWPRTCVILLLIPLIIVVGICEWWGGDGREYAKPGQSPDATRTTIENGKAALASGKYDEAISHFTELIDTKRGGDEALQLRAQSYIAKREYASAIADLSVAIAGQPKGPAGNSARLCRAFAYFHIGRYTESKTDYDAVVGALNPTGPAKPPTLDLVHAIIGRAAAMIRLGQAAGAAEDLNWVIGTRVPVSEVAGSTMQVLQRHTYVGTGPARRQVTMPELRSVPTSWFHKVYSFDVPALKIRGDAKSHLGDWDGALADYEQALLLANDDPEVLARLANAYFELGRHQEAVQARSRVPGSVTEIVNGLPSIVPEMVSSEFVGDRPLTWHIEGKKKERLTEKEERQLILDSLKTHSTVSDQQDKRMPPTEQRKDNPE